MSTNGWREKRCTRPVDAHLDTARRTSGGFGQILQRAEQLQRLDKLLGQILESSLSPHVKLANVRDDLLILVTPVAPIATRLRLQEDQILNTLRDHGVSRFKTIKVLVAPLPAQIMTREDQAGP